LTYEAVVIGGGVMGCMSAYSLAKRGLKNVLLLESGRLANAATGQSAAMLVHQTGDRLLTELAQQSILAYRSFSENSGWDIDLHRTGSILYCTKPSDIEVLSNGLQIQNDFGVTSRNLSTREISRLCPEVDTDGILGATYCSLDGYLSTRALLQELRTHLASLGVTVSEKQHVTYITKSGGSTFKIGTSAGEVSALRVINAAGASATNIAGWLGDTLPITLSKRHLFLFRPPEKPQSFPIMENVSDEWYFRQHGRSILVGMGTVEIQGASEAYDFSDPDRDPRSREIAYSYIAQRFPKWDGILCETFWAGVRPMTPDGRPIISRSENCEGLFHCAGLSAFGISTAPACGDILASLVLDDNAPAIESAIEQLSVKRSMDADSGTSNRVGDDTVLPIRPGEIERESAQRNTFANIIQSMPKQFRTPYYLYDIERLREDAKRLRDAFPNFELLYAYKSNPIAPVADAVTQLGFGADVSSLSDLRLAQQAGVPSAKIVFGGPGKTDANLCMAVMQSGCTVSIESVQELKVFQKFAIEHHVRVPILIRVNCAHRPQIAGEFMAGGPSQFGTDEEVIQEFAGQVDSNLVEFQGIHVHVASQILDEDAIIDHYVKTAQLAMRVSEKLQQPLRMINFGGGIGVPYSNHEQSLDHERIAQRADASLSKVLAKNSEAVRLQLELGRSVSANCGVFVTKIVDIKQSRGKHYVITEAGISAFSRPAMPWAQQHRCWTLPPRRGQIFQCTVTGRSCLPADILVRAAALEAPAIGDLICVEQAGAYGFSMSLLHWAGMDAPIEVAFENGAYELVSDTDNRVAPSALPTEDA
jgi:diaminopimelate decarboxylase